MYLKEAGDEESAPPPDRRAASAESRIYELFQATYRSSLTCSSCRHQSNTYDPFFCLSLPIPQSTLVSVTVVIVYLDERPRQIRVAVKMSTGDTVRHLLTKLSKLSQVPDGQVGNAFVYSSKIDGFLIKVRACKKSCCVCRCSYCSFKRTPMV